MEDIPHPGTGEIWTLGRESRGPPDICPGSTERELESLFSSGSFLLHCGNNTRLSFWNLDDIQLYQLRGGRSPWSTVTPNPGRCFPHPTPRGPTSAPGPPRHQAPVLLLHHSQTRLPLMCQEAAEASAIVSGFQPAETGKFTVHTKPAHHLLAGPRHLAAPSSKAWEPACPGLCVHCEWETPRARPHRMPGRVQASLRFPHHFPLSSARPLTVPSKLPNKV